MDAREFDALVSRITSLASRRTAVLGLAGGALTSVGLAAEADARKKQRGKHARGKQAQGKQRGKDSGKRVAADHFRRKKGKICICASYEMLECETLKVKKKKFASLLLNNPGSYEGACEPFSKWVPGRDR